MTTYRLAPDCDACATCIGCGLSWCRDETPSPGEVAGLCPDCWLFEDPKVWLIDDPEELA